MRKVNLSTGGFPNFTGVEISKEIIDYGLKDIELSGGRYDQNAVENIKKIHNKANFSLHNYFPPPKKSFVINLASANNFIFERSIEHAKKAIDICKITKSNAYSLHAGFRIDPDVNELGKKISPKKLIGSYKDALLRFQEALKILSTYSSEKKIDIYIENNVFSAQNKKSFDTNPFLLSTCEEIEQFLDYKPSNVKLLLDVAHLKVSANSLNFNAKETLTRLKSYVSAYHLSDNNGLADTNDFIDSKSWFWKYINYHADFYTIEVYRKDISFLKEQVKLVKKHLGE